MDQTTLGPTLRFGLMADVHKDIMHDADARLHTFIEHMQAESVDFIVQLGDLCQPTEQNRPFLKVWESFKGPRYHVLGNHDTDGGFTREQVLKYWSMPARFYSFDEGDYHFVVLDGNDEREGRAPGYPHFMAADQLEWLRNDLEQAQRPTLIFSHQSLEDMEDPEQGVENGAEVRGVLEEINLRAGRPQVIACFSGHNHVDAHRCIGGIHYIQINSMSNYWLGDAYQEIRYSEEVDRAFPWIKYTVPYEKPLYALVTLGADGTVEIEGTSSEFVGVSPWQQNYPYTHIREQIVPKISDRKLVAGQINSAQ
jgi:calcineurin-like phosphoesterase family protein